MLHIRLAVLAVLVLLSPQGVHAATVTFDDPALNGTAANIFTVPLGVNSATLDISGGGGGGGGNGGSGGGGGGAAAVSGLVVGVVPGETVVVTVGAGGAGGTLNFNGGTGGTTSFGAYASMQGGQGGFAYGQGGTAGGPGGEDGGTSFVGPANGGNSVFGAGGVASSDTLATGRNATGYGAGGGGAENPYSSGVRVGGRGSSGFVRVVYTVVLPPATPLNVNTNPDVCGSGRINISWSAAPGASGYDVERDGVVFSVGNVTSYAHNGLIPGSAHGYRIRSNGVGGTSSWSPLSSMNAPMICAPVAPTGFTASPSTCGNTWLNLSWNPVPGATSYVVEEAGVVVYSGVGTAFSHTGIPLGSTHHYTLVAKNAGGSSPQTSVTGTASGYCPAIVIVTPSTLEVANSTAFVVTMNSSDASACRYTRMRDGVVEFSNAPVSGPGNTLFSNTAFHSGSISGWAIISGSSDTYIWEFQCQNGAGSWGVVGTAEVTIKAPVPVASFIPAGTNATFISNINMAREQLGFTVSNIGELNSNLVINAVTSDSPTLFWCTSGCTSGNITVGGPSHEVYITFKPSTLGCTPEIPITFETNIGPITKAVLGQCVNPLDASFNFGRVAVGKTRVRNDITITNNGVLTIPGGTFDLTDPYRCADGSGNFVLSCPYGPIAPGASVTFSVEFAPPLPTAYNGVMGVFSGYPSSPVLFSGSGILANFQYREN